MIFVPPSLAASHSTSCFCPMKEMKHRKVTRNPTPPSVAFGLPLMAAGLHIFLIFVEEGNSEKLQSVTHLSVVLILSHIYLRGRGDRWLTYTFLFPLQEEGCRENN